MTRMAHGRFTLWKHPNSVFANTIANFVLFWGLLFTLGCQKKDSNSGPSDGQSAHDSPLVYLGEERARQSLGEDVAAVASTRLSKIQLKERALLQHISPKKALEQWLVDVAFAHAAIKQQLDKDMAAKLAINRLLARAYTKRIGDDALSKGPFTADEVEAVLGDEWVDLKRPETRLAVHSLVKTNVADARTVAARLRSFLADVSSDMSFLQKAQTFAMPSGASLIVEPIPAPFTRDGTMATRKGGHLDPKFSEAVFQLKEGQVSDVVESSFGFHVIRLSSIRPAYEASFDEKVQRLRPRLLRARTVHLFEQRLAQLRASAKVSLMDVGSLLAAPFAPNLQAARPKEHL